MDMEKPDMNIETKGYRTGRGKDLRRRAGRSVFSRCKNASKRKTDHLVDGDKGIGIAIVR